MYDFAVMNEENPYQSVLISIVMATYNGQKFVRQQLDSILSQSYSNFEVIIVDDGSTDITALMIQDYVDKDPRITFFPSKHNLGLVKNFERGLIKARGELLVLADQDDIFNKHKIEKQLAMITATPEADMVISDLELIDEHDKQLAESMWGFQGVKPEKQAPFKRLCIDNYATGCSMLFTRKLLEYAIPFPAQLKIHDQWFALLAARKSGGGIEVIREPLTRYRQHQGNVIGAKSSKQLNWFNVCSKLFSLNGLKIYHQNSVQLISEKHLRVLSFLERSDLFSRQEVAYLRLLESILVTYLPGSDISFIRRMACLPRAFYLSYFSRNFWQMSVRFLLLSIFPTKNSEKNKHDQTT